MINKKIELPKDYFTSYSANFEDVILHRLFSGQVRGFYVDVGAAHPTFENDTKLFYDLGWSGINVEPNPEFFALLSAERKRDRNFCTALSDRGGRIKYYDVVNTGLSTCDPKLAQQAKIKGHKVIPRRVPVSTLMKILDNVGPASIEFLKIDVEGFEERVLAGNDWTRFRPLAILIEVTYPESPERRPTGIRKYLTERGYRWRYFDGLNDFYTADEFQISDGVFDRPPNVFDGFKLRSLVDLERHAANLTIQVERTQEYAKSLTIELEQKQETEKNSTIQLERTQEHAKSLTIELEQKQETEKNLTIQLEQTQEQARAIEFERCRLEKAGKTMRLELINFSGRFEQGCRDREELLHIKDQYFAVLNSTCWRGTAPIRTVGNNLKRLLHGILPNLIIRLIQRIRTR